MKEYYFLFAIAFAFTIFAVVQDLKKREIANWLNFSLIAIALFYRITYSIIKKDASFALIGFFTFGVFIALSYMLYYSSAFAGGDAKLLMAFGLIAPFSELNEVLLNSIIFIFVLFTVGTAYSIIYSAGIAIKNLKKFKKELSSNIKKQSYLSLISLLVFIVYVFLSLKKKTLLPLSIIFLIPLLYTYVKSIEICLIKKRKPSELTEGDWLVSDIRLKNTVIKKTVHGLSLKDIALIKKYNKEIEIKDGIPFSPAFLISLALMALVSLFLEASLLELLLSFLP